MNKKQMVENIVNLITEGNIEEARNDFNHIIDNQIYTRDFLTTKIKELGERGDNCEIFTKNYKSFKASGTKCYEKIYPIVVQFMSGDKSLKIHNKQTLINELNVFKNNFPKYDAVINEILEYIEKESDFFSSYSKSEKVYEAEFMQILLADNAVSVFRKFNWDNKTFYNKLNLFKTKFTSERDVQYANYIEKQFQEYLRTYKSTRITNYTPIKSYILEEILKDLFASNCSIYEYCDKNLEYNVSDITKTIKAVYTTKQADLIIENLKKLESPSFQNKLENIALQIVTDPDFTILDYYQATKLSLYDFKAKVKYRSDELSRFVTGNSLINFNHKSNGTTLFSKKKELEVKRIIRGVEITEQDKINIFNYLENNEIPVDRFTYRACINKLLDGTLDFEQKNKHLKGSF